MKHKHCELIKAWADGAIIQILSPDYGIDCEIGESWKTIVNPKWADSHKYRIKPKTVKYRLWLNSYNVVWAAMAGETPEKHPLFVKWLGFWQEVEV